MDQFVSYCSLIFFLLLPLFLIKIKSRSSNPNLKLPPGPRPLPIIGNIHHLSGPVPHRALHKLSLKYGELLFLQLGELPTVVVSSSTAAREIMKTHDLNFATRDPKTAVKILTYQGKDVAFAPYGDYWRQVRKLSTLELLSMKRVQSFRSIREAEVGNLIKSITSMSSNRELVNLSKELYVMINNTAVRAIVGSKSKDQNAFIRVLQNGFDLGSGLTLVDMFPSSRLVCLVSTVAREAEKCHREMDRLLDGMIQEHRERKKEKEVKDLLGVLLELYDEGSHKLSLSMDTIKAVIFDAFEAGSESSTALLDWAMFELIRNPEVMKKAQSEVRELFQNRSNITESDFENLNFLHLIIKETLRLHPPLPLLLPRECQETCNILGYDIPKGATVLVNVWTIGRDETNWKDAEAFMPERFMTDKNNIDYKGLDFELLPFGAGRRMCPGINFGLANMQLALASLLYHFDWQLPDGVRAEELDVIESAGLSARRKADLWLRAIPYVSS